LIFTNGKKINLNQLVALNINLTVETESELDQETVPTPRAHISGQITTRSDYFKSSPRLSPSDTQNSAIKCI